MIVEVGWYFLPFTLYILSVYTLTRWYHFCRLSNGEHSIWLLLALMPVLACGLGFFTAFTRPVSTPSGLLMLLAAIPFTLIILLRFFNGSNRQKTKNDAPQERWWIKPLAIILVLVMGLSPILGVTVIGSACYKLHTQSAEPIITALYGYKAENGEYPDDLEMLVPAYLQQIPKPVCLSIIPFLNRSWQTYEEDDGQYHIGRCNTHNSKTLLILPSVVGYNPHQYDMQTGEWELSIAEEGCHSRN